MKKVIYKYGLPFYGASQILLPTGAEIIKVGEQDSKLFIWAIVDSDNPNVEREFIVIGTGYEYTELKTIKKHIETVIMSNGLVWHVFELI